MMTNVISAAPVHEFAADVRAGLTKAGQKELPSKYLYDSLGSKLFEAICELPEYGLTRADERLLERHAAEIVERIPGGVVVCELGSGSGRKTRWILEALSRRRRIAYYPIDISPSALAACERELADIRSVGIVGLEREYLDGLLEVTARRPAESRILVLFLGSTIGNCSHPADLHFLRQTRELLHPGDGLLLGTDLEKPISQLVEAYDDPLGVTAAFNMNLLSRINRELAGEFPLRHFGHEARFNSETRSIEMHLSSKRAQTVHIARAGISVEFADGESIWTENSHKYSLEEVRTLTAAAGFHIRSQWIDRSWPFAESLLIAE
jgi:dimethylhistidine N-methyltransferase